MSKPQSKDVCALCGAELEYKGPYQDSYHRFDQYTCVSCKWPIHFDRDPLIKDEFPEIEKVSIEVLRKDTKVSNTFDENSHDVLLCCSNPRCNHPGIIIELTLREMLSKNETHREYWEFCSGADLTPTGRLRTACDQSFKVTIDIVLKSSEASEKKGDS